MNRHVAGTGTTDEPSIRPGPSRIEDVLQIFIITYNRAPSLERTLSTLSRGPFASGSITILDNCSTDATAEVCRKYEASLRACRTMRHRVNIGPSANLLRAFELSTSPYTWVLCDDDLLDFSDCYSVVHALLSGSYGCICVGVPGSLPWAWGQDTTCRMLFDSNPRFFHMASFVPSLIYRTAICGSSELQRAYGLAGLWFPHLVFAAKLLRTDARIFVSPRPLVRQANADPYPWTRLSIATCYALTCEALITDLRDRRRAIYEMLGGHGGHGAWPFLAGVATQLAFSKAVDHHLRTRLAYRSTQRIFTDLWLACTWDQRLLLLACVPLLVVPATFFRAFRVLYRWVRYTLRGRRPGPWFPPDTLFVRPATMVRETSSPCQGCVASDENATRKKP